MRVRGVRNVDTLRGSKVVVAEGEVPVSTPSVDETTGLVDLAVAVNVAAGCDGAPVVSDVAAVIIGIVVCVDAAANIVAVVRVPKYPRQ